MFKQKNLPTWSDQTLDGKDKTVWMLKDVQSCSGTWLFTLYFHSITNTAMYMYDFFYILQQEFEKRQRRTATNVIVLIWTKKNCVVK